MWQVTNHFFFSTACMIIKLQRTTRDKQIAKLMTEKGTCSDVSAQFLSTENWTFTFTSLCSYWPTFEKADLCNVMQSNKIILQQIPCL